MFMPPKSSRPPQWLLLGLTAVMAALTSLSLPAAGWSQQLDNTVNNGPAVPEKLVNQIERRLGNKKDGFYVIAFQETVFNYWMRARVVAGIQPITKYFVDKFGDRHAAATAITQHLLRFQGLAPKPSLPPAPPTPPPVANWVLIGRYETEDKATEAVDKANKTLMAQGTYLGAMPHP